MSHLDGFRSMTQAEFDSKYAENRRSGECREAKVFFTFSGENDLDLLDDYAGGEYFPLPVGMLEVGFVAHTWRDET